MRHIKEYRIFESSSLKENEQILGDICQELKDDGYYVFTTRDPNMHNDSDTEHGRCGIVVDVESPVSPFSYNLVKEFFDRMDRYMSSEGWLSKLSYRKHGYTQTSVRFYTIENLHAYSYRIEFFHVD